MNILVLSGGLSTERNVSFTTGAMVQNALIRSGHRAILADVFMDYDLKGTIEEEFENATTPAEIKKISELVPDIEKIKAQRGYDNGVYFGKNVIELCQYADIVFMALHGGEGENGRLQAAFDLLGIKYTGNGYLSSAVSMHKNLTKEMFKAHGVTTPNARMVTPEDKVSFSDFNSKSLVIKPCSGGSSIGVFIVDNEKDFKNALNDAFKYENEILIEEYVKGREFSVGYLGGVALPSIEIIPKEGFYDYKNKYQASLTDEICPANISVEEEKALRDATIKAAKALGIEVYARMDFILDENGKAYCLEANSLPGMTPTSLLPQEAAADGISYDELCEKIINISLKK